MQCICVLDYHIISSLLASVNFVTKDRREKISWFLVKRSKQDHDAERCKYNLDLVWSGRFFNDYRATSKLTSSSTIVYENVEWISDRVEQGPGWECGLGIFRLAVIETAGMAPTICNRCGDAVEEGCDPREELAELDALLERIRIKRYALKRKINQHHSPIVRKLSPDVTSTIFEFCLPDFTDHQLSPYTDEDTSIPLSLGTICSYWRDIAWSTPSL